MGILVWVYDCLAFWFVLRSVGLLWVFGFVRVWFAVALFVFCVVWCLFRFYVLGLPLTLVNFDLMCCCLIGVWPACCLGYLLLFGFDVTLGLFMVGGVCGWVCWIGFEFWLAVVRLFGCWFNLISFDFGGGFRLSLWFFLVVFVWCAVVLLGWVGWLLSVVWFLFWWCFWLMGWFVGGFYRFGAFGFWFMFGFALTDFVLVLGCFAYAWLFWWDYLGLPYCWFALFGWFCLLLWICLFCLAFAFWLVF